MRKSKIRYIEAKNETLHTAVRYLQPASFHVAPERISSVNKQKQALEEFVRVSRVFHISAKPYFPFNVCFIRCMVCQEKQGKTPCHVIEIQDYLYGHSCKDRFDNVYVRLCRGPHSSTFYKSIQQPESEFTASIPPRTPC